MNTLKQASKILPLPLLEHIGIIVTFFRTTEPFVAKNKFILNYNYDLKTKPEIYITSLNDNFKEWFLPKIEKPMAKTMLEYKRLTRSSVNGPIMRELRIKELKDERETTLAQIYTLMECQKNEELSVLLVRGANIFYVPDVKGILRVVFVFQHPDSNGWFIYAREVTNQRAWGRNDRIFFRSERCSCSHRIVI